ncbi:MAG: pyridoxal-phosphate dependent enzyme [Anaerolineae bacterium]|nr:pyridoxal-phosphate dependent enzyme [Anaerolineae bacterium]
MLRPARIEAGTRRRARQVRDSEPQDVHNLFNISWRDSDDRIMYFLLPPQLTGVETPIAVLYGRDFPSGSHKVGAAYSVLLELELFGEVDPAQHTLVWPSTGNYGIGGAWVGGRMGCDSVVVLPEGMSRERFERIEQYGARIRRTVGSESNVKEIYDETRRLRESGDHIRILNQFDLMGNYRFHYYVTGNTIAELADELARSGIGSGVASAFVSAMGSAGTIAAGDRLKQIWPQHKIVGLEPQQCPTLYNNGYGAHDIEGIGDKHVTWIHNVLNMDALMCIDDRACKQGLQLLSESRARQVLVERYGADPALVALLGTHLGISGVCNILGAIKTVRHYGFGADDLVVTVATDALDRYHSVMVDMARQYGELDEAAATGRIERIFRGAGQDWILPGTPDVRQRWHNLKYYTWVEQQGKTVEELDAQRDPAWWEAGQRRVAEIDGRLLRLRASEATAAS